MEYGGCVYYAAECVYITKGFGKDPGLAEPYEEEDEGEDVEGHAEGREEWEDGVGEGEEEGVLDVAVSCVCGSEGDLERFTGEEGALWCVWNVNLELWGEVNFSVAL